MNSPLFPTAFLVFASLSAAFSPLLHAGARFDRFQGLLNAPDGPSDIGAFLALLKSRDEFRSLFSSYTLASDSRSLQASTPEKPRAILFGDDAGLIVAFGSDPGFSGGAEIETAEYESETRRIVFREVLFKNELPLDLKRRLGNLDTLKKSDRARLASLLQLAPEEIGPENSRTLVTTGNPGKCLACHQVNSRHPGEARYIWSGYATWPGLFGANDDFATSDELLRFKTLAAPRPDLSGAGYPGHDRYRNLDLGPTGSFPYKPEFSQGPYEYRPNLRLTKLLGGHQAETFAPLIQKQLAEPLLRELSAALLCDNDPAAIFAQVNAVKNLELPRSLTLPALEDDMNMGSSAMPVVRRGRYPNGLTDQINWVLVRDYLSRAPRTRAMIDDLIQANIDQNQKSRLEDGQSLLHNLSAGFVEALSRYFVSYDNRYDTRQLCGELGGS